MYTYDDPVYKVDIYIYANVVCDGGHFLVCLFNFIEKMYKSHF